MTRRSSGKINWGIFILKLFLSMLAICVFIGIIYQGYILFTHQTNSVTGTILFLLGLGFWIWLVVILRIPKYQYSMPSFWLVFTVVLGISLTCAFAGIEPLSTYKDDVIQKTVSITKTLAEKMPPTTDQILSEPIGLPIATTTRIWADWKIVFGYHRDYIYVQLKPTNIAVANKEYTVDLYEKGKFRAKGTVSWNQPELNVLKEHIVTFGINREECEAYQYRDISHIFSVKVHE